MTTPAFRGEALTRARVFAGRSRTDLASAAGISAAGLRLIEKGETTPRPATAKALADALGIDVAELYGEGAVA